MTTPTPIETFEDILAAMERNPHLRAAMRQHILDQEFLQLPSIVRELQQTVAELAQLVRDYIQSTNERLDRLERDVAELKAGQANLQQDVAELKIGQARLESDVAELKTGQARLESDVAELKTGQARLDGNMNRLIGSDYERKAARRAGRLVQRHLGISGFRVIYAITTPDQNRIPDLLNRAIAEGAITADEADELENADIILESDGQYTVTEVSVVLDEDDVKRSRERADLLVKVTTAPVKATAIGTHALASAVQFAANNEVVIMHLPE